MPSFHAFLVKATGLLLLFRGAASLSQVRTDRTRRASKPSVSIVADVDDYDYGAGLDKLKQGEAVVYDHMPKAGGTFLIQLLKASIGQELFSYESEFENLTQDDINKKFVIGSVRNPCDYYLSLWAYGVEHGGAMMASIPDEMRWVYETESEMKDSEADVHRFRRWVSLINVEGHPGVMSVRFAQSYATLDTMVRASSPPMALKPRELNAVERALSTPAFMKAVDCWVQVDHIKSGAADCLRKWHKKTGLHVNWDGYMQALNASETLSSSHRACKKYYTPKLEQLVRKLEAPIFKNFNYDTCCI